MLSDEAERILSEKVSYFDKNLNSIIYFSDEVQLSHILKDNIHNTLFKESLLCWPDDIKSKIVDIYLQNTVDKNNIEITENSWEEFYEMYDGKLDEKNMLHITLKASFQKDIEGLGYLAQKPDESWHKPLAGEYNFNDEGDIIIIHACPDIEIFDSKIDQFIDELNIHPEWVKKAELTAM
ncbi:hypothetical protein [Prochlorococcus sp. MIT 1341]|uniref:hypothetical protein n=1 Tax=Prochlorococcus sp. MIT 1341 TaxID=3096221 RepID=UPI002A74F045|nr:hypothetical protein [Prochlorococcus sp. MIT 1341]